MRDPAAENRVQAKAEPRRADKPSYDPQPEHAVELVPPNTFDAQIGFDRSELRTAIKRMRQCADDLERLNMHNIHHILREKYRLILAGIVDVPRLGDVLSELPQLRDYAESLPWRLRLLARAAETAAQDIYLRGRPMYDGAAASLTSYVHRITRRWCDEEVSALIAAATDRPNYDAVAHQDWRRRNRKLLADPGRR